MKIQYLLLSIITFSNLALATPNIENSTNLSHAIGQMMMVGFKGTTVDENSPIVQEIKKYHIGGIILCNHHEANSKKITTNIKNPTQLKNLISQLQFYAKKYNGHPLFIAINQEGGLINTLKHTQGFNNFNDPSQFELGKSAHKIIFNKTLKRALLLKDVGINVNLAPVADLNINPDNPAVGKLQRSFGSNHMIVTNSLQSAISAYRKANILCTLKHFPGLGSAAKNTDYHKANLTQSWKNIELIPYQYLIQSNNSCPFVMVGHLINERLDKSGMPASLSKTIITDLLIKKLAYQGLVITDDMDARAIRNHFSTYVAIKKAVLAGNNVIIYGGTQGYDPDKDTEMLFNTLFDLANKNPEIRNKVLISYAKNVKMKELILKSSLLVFGSPVLGHLQ